MGVPLTSTNLLSSLGVQRTTHAYMFLFCLVNLLTALGVVPTLNLCANDELLVERNDIVPSTEMYLSVFLFKYYNESILYFGIVN